MMSANAILSHLRENLPKSLYMKGMNSKRIEVPIQMILVRKDIFWQACSFSWQFLIISFLSALIRLNEPLPFYYDDDVKSAVIPVCLPWNKNDIGRDLNAGVKLTVTGWGRSTNDEYTNRFNLANYNVPTTLLQKLDIPLVSEIECLKVKPYRERLQMDFNLQFCAGGEEGKNSFPFCKNCLSSNSL